MVINNPQRNERMAGLPERCIEFKVFSSFDEEREADRARRAAMTGAQRMRELAVLQERTFGKGWTKKPMKKVFSWELLPWYRDDKAK